MGLGSGLSPYYTPLPLVYCIGAGACALLLAAEALAVFAQARNMRWPSGARLLGLAACAVGVDALALAAASGGLYWQLTHDPRFTSGAELLSPEVVKRLSAFVHTLTTWGLVTLAVTYILLLAGWVFIAVGRRVPESEKSAES